MALLRKAPAAPAPAPEPEREPRPGGKGRATPKRRDAEKQRRTPTAAPASRREAYRRRREEVSSERRVMRAALRTGDEKHLPPRDAGPARGYVRDLVDARRNAGGLLVIALLVSLALGSVKSAAVSSGVFLLFVLSILAVAIDMTLLVRRVRREVRARFSDRDVPGAGAYAVMRALQFRRWRMPPPRVGHAKRR